MNKKITVLVFLISVLVISGCNFPLFNNSEEDAASLLSTAVAETVQALSNQPELPQDQVQTPDQSALPTITPLPTLTQQAIVLPPTQTPLPCDKALFISETIPDDTEYAPGETFTKSWTFKNVGTCTWNTNYKMVFSTGDAMGGPASVNLTTTVAPDAQVTVSVDLTAPAAAGTYTGYWKLQGGDGKEFGQVYVRIKSKSAIFQVTSVTYSMTDDTLVITCPSNQQVTIKGNITTNAAGQVTYYWKDSTGTNSATKAINFAAAETKTVEHTMTVSAAYNYFAQIYIDNPNHQLFGVKNFSATCN